jgi:hypothetical protein
MTTWRWRPSIHSAAMPPPASASARSLAAFDPLHGDAVDQREKDFECFARARVRAWDNVTEADPLAMLTAAPALSCTWNAITRCRLTQREEKWAVE